jgi:AcrR family transcriptional regulator
VATQPALAASSPAAHGLPVELRGTQFQRRQRIVDAALELLRESNGENIHVRDVADRAGVALGTVYRYMGSKDRLFAEAYQKWAEARFVDLARSAKKGRTNTQRLRRIAFGFLETFATEPHFLNLVRLELAGSTEPAVRSVLDEVAAGFRTLCGDALDGIDRTDVAAIAGIVIAVVFAALDQLTIRGASLDQAKRGVAIAVRTILEFQDPTSRAASGGTRRR